MRGDIDMAEDNMLSNAFDKLNEMLGTEEGQKQISDIISAFSKNTESENDSYASDSTDINNENRANDVNNENDKNRENKSSANKNENPLSALSNLDLSNLNLSEILNSASHSQSSDTPDISAISGLSGMSGVLSAIMSNKTAKNNPNSAFLQALKPFLKSDRREKVDSAIKLLSYASVLKELGGVFSLKGGD